MEVWNVSPDAELLADVQLGSCAASTVAWCPVYGLLAVGARVQDNLAYVHLMSVHCLEQKVTLAVPLTGPDDDLISVAWSPCGCPRMLLTATRAGKLSAWTQQPPERNQQQHITAFEDWWCHDVAQLIDPAGNTPAQAASISTQEHLSHVQWLQPPPASPYSNHPLQPRDFEAGSLMIMFAPAAPRRRHSSSTAAASAAGTKQEPTQDGSSQNPAASGAAAAVVGDELDQWVRPGTPAILAVLSSGDAVACWPGRGLVAAGPVQWRTTTRMPLLTSSSTTAAAAPAAVPDGNSGPTALLAADATVDAEGLLVAFSMRQEPATVHIVRLRGNPQYLQYMGGSRTALQVQQVASCSLQVPPGSSIASLTWEPGSQGQQLLAAVGTADSSSAAGASSDPGQRCQLMQLSLVDQPQQQQQPEQQQPGQQQQQGLSLVVSHAAQVATAPNRQQVAWLLDGLLCASGPLEQQLQMHACEQLQPLSMQFKQPHVPTGFGWRPRNGSSSSSQVLHAVAASPHGVAVAAVVSWPDSSRNGSSSSSGSDKNSRLLVYHVPPAAAAAAAGSDGVAPVLAGRLLWALLQQCHRWDLVQHILQTAKQLPQQQQQQQGVSHGNSSNSSSASAAVQSQRVADVLALVDKKLSAQQMLVTTYSSRWDPLKLAVLSQTPGPDAQAVSIDLRLRMLSFILRPQYDFLREDDPSKAREQQHQQHRQQPAYHGLAPLQQYLAAVVDFELACFKTWVHRRQEAHTAAAAAANGNGTTAAADAAAAAANRVPCVRHMLEWRIWNVFMMAFLKSSEMVLGQKDVKIYNLFKVLVKSAATKQETPSTPEEPVQALVSGPFSLHQHDQTRPDYLPSFSLAPEQLMQQMAPHAGWRELPVMTDAEIAAEATRLGLLPATPPGSADGYRQELRWRMGFRRQVPSHITGSASSSPITGAVPASAASAASAAGAGDSSRGGVSSQAARLTALKRHHWELQLEEVLGNATWPGVLNGKPVADLAHLDWVHPASPGLMRSLDGALLTRGGVPGAGEARSMPKGLLDVLTNAWSYVSPFTCELWMRGMRSAATGF